MVVTGTMSERSTRVNTRDETKRRDRAMVEDGLREESVQIREKASEAYVLSSSVATTDFFGFDTSDNHDQLQGLGNVSEMGDAVLGLVADKMGSQAPRWVAVRNVSDPQIKAEGALRQQAALAGQIYKAFGRWSSVCSAIVCWALIAAE